MVRSYVDFGDETIKESTRVDIDLLVHRVDHAFGHALLHGVDHEVELGSECGSIHREAGWSAKDGQTNGGQEMEVMML